MIAVGKKILQESLDTNNGSLFMFFMPGTHHFPNCQNKTNPVSGVVLITEIIILN